MQTGRRTAHEYKVAEKEKSMTYFTGEGDDSRSLLLSVLRGRPWGREGFRGERNDTDADEDFLDSTRLSLYEGRRESVEPSGAAADPDVAVLGAVEVLLDGGASILGWASGPAVATCSCCFLPAASVPK